MGFQQAQIRAAKTHVYLPLTTALTVNNHQGCRECEVERIYSLPTWSLPTVGRPGDTLYYFFPSETLLFPDLDDWLWERHQRRNRRVPWHPSTQSQHCCLGGKWKIDTVLRQMFCMKCSTIDTPRDLWPVQWFHSHRPLTLTWIILMSRQEEYHFICVV